jgi:hypothetical protein
LPALSAILKTRKRKLGQISSISNSDSLIIASVFVDTTKQTLNEFTKQVNSVNEISTMNKTNTFFLKNLDSISITFEVSREFNVRVFEQAQKTAILNF